MANKIITTQVILSSAVANNGTVTVNYPSGYAQVNFTGSYASANGQVIINKNDLYLESASKCSFSYGSSNVTLTNTSGGSWAAGAVLDVGLCALTGAPVVGSAPVAAITDLTAATGTTGNTVNDVGASFSQTTLNNNFKVLADKINAINAALKAARVTL